MNITVYCGSALGDNSAYESAARQLGTWMGQNGHTLIYGGAHAGLMGVIADSVLHNGGEAIGVLPDVLIEREPPHKHLTKFFQVRTMAERKAKMIELGDVFVAMPGGPGTLEELSEIISLGKIGTITAACILLNIDGYYDALVEVFDRMLAHGFMDAKNRSQLLNARSVKDIEEWLQNGL